MVVVLVLVDLWWWWQRWFDITGDGGILGVVVMVMGFLKRTHKAKNILFYMAVSIVWL